MDSSISYNDDERTESHISNSQSLELAYKESLRKADFIIRDEGARRLRLHILLLESENDDLHEQLALADDRIDTLEQEHDEVRAQQEHAEDDACHYENELRAQTRELSNLKAELTSMNGITLDSTKLLTEKLSLARELAALKPEVDHLRSQVSYHRNILSEKLALQRQISTLEVELETEKRASNRAAQKVGSSTREGEYQQQLEELRKELARERREMEKARKEAEKDLNESDNRKTVLESKLDQMRTKLRTTKEELKECQNELGQARAAAVKGLKGTTSGEAPIRNSRKRGALEMSTDVAIGTPDGIAVRKKRPVVKRTRTDQTMLGEKSMFSITPYLNRTVNMDMEPDSQAVDKEREVEGLATEAKITGESMEGEEATQHPLDNTKSTSAFQKVFAKSKLSDNARQVERNVLAEGSASSANKKPGLKKSRPLNTLEKVTEEDVDENQQPDPAVDVGIGDATKPVASKTLKVQQKNSEPDGVEPKRKKRKLLGGGKTLFDEEDGEATKRPAKVALGPPRLLGKGNLPAPKGGPGAFVAGSAFDAFSPLKKDRRGVGASFLA